MVLTKTINSKGTKPQMTMSSRSERSPTMSTRNFRRRKMRTPLKGTIIKSINMKNNSIRSKTKKKMVGKICAIDDPSCEECMTEEGCEKEKFDRCECSASESKTNKSDNLNFEKYLKSLDIKDFFREYFKLLNYTANPFEYYLN